MRYENNEDFVKRCIEKHDDKYDYSITFYKKWNKKINIRCKKHGVFSKIPAKHIQGEGCPKCATEKRGSGNALSKFEFINKANIIHNGKYNYSLVNYINSRIKIKIICPEHGEYKQIPTNHLKGNGCPKCYENNIKKSKEDWIKLFNQKHGDIYEYYFDNDFNSKTKIKIKCKKHGVFEQTIDNHKSGQGCKKCAIEKRTKQKRLTTEKFIKKAIKKHGDIYDYSLVKYGKSNKEKVKIICSEHGEYKQTPRGHLYGFGCPKCSSSKGEKEVRKVLENNNVKYIEQYVFEDCIYKSPLKFDFYLPEYNVCIEYDGIQHFEPIDFFGGEKAFLENKKRDSIKDIYCKENNIKLIRINNIEDIYLPY
jgi:hypothetical protein